ncbi:DcaP family trimeric outer membrane transporter [Acinetobacter sp. ANC 3813]|uniref:DcaP family trimeric outer membrane transporter n=1 Tax=Acinetobacter sp. ANC 3813 TaxID=1977873 RepID=UPI000A332FEE|nr:DcaP family trimeric outer membrane transporter [Acinetobacter sp. ANC 3813]OTG90868.1 hypothetical protein B9T34_05695 [Acinetobacter sp. ANC 3813]
MALTKHALAIAVCTLPTIIWANGNLNTEIEELRKKLEVLEQKANVQDQQIKEMTAVKPEAAKPLSGIELKPYGFVRADIAYHFEGSDKIFNKINTVPLNDSTQSANGKTLFNVNASRLGLDLKTKIDQQDVSGKIEIDFRGGSEQDQLRIRHAYIKVNNWLFGQTTSPFVSADILPEMVDFMANVGGGIQRNPMIQYQHQFNKNMSSWVALEDGANSKNLVDKTRLPALTTKTQFKSDDGKSVLNVRTLAMQKKTSSDEALTWGLGVGGVYQIDSQNKLHADYYHVKGDNKFMLFANDAYAVNADKEIIENEYDSLALGFTHNWNSQWRSTLGFGAMRADDGGEYARLMPAANESLYQGWVNLFYSPSKSLTYAVEYVYGERTTFESKQGTDSRLEAMVRYAF